jgi:hypothetical protein
MKDQSKATAEQLDPPSGVSIGADRATRLQRYGEAGRLYLIRPPGAGKSALALRMVARLTGIGGIGDGE